MSDLHGWQRLMVQREARASGALDGETQHVAAADGSCCWEHAMAKIAELEDANTRMRQRLEDVEALKAEAVKLEEMTLLEGMWRKRVAELEAEKQVIVAELTALREQVTWIPVDVRMPPINTRVEGVYQERSEGWQWQQWAIFTWHPKHGWWDEAMCAPLDDDCEMVYWRPVPSLPGDSKEASDGAA